MVQFLFFDHIEAVAAVCKVTGHHDVVDFGRLNRVVLWRHAIGASDEQLRHAFEGLTT